MLYKSWQIWMCGSLVCHHVYYVFYYCFVCCTYPSYFPFFFFFFFFWNELSWKLIKNVYLNRGPNKLMLQCPSLLHQMYMLFINWMYFICDNKLCWTWTWFIHFLHSIRHFVFFWSMTLELSIKLVLSCLVSHLLNKFKVSNFNWHDWRTVAWVWTDLNRLKQHFWHDCKQPPFSPIDWTVL